MRKPSDIRELGRLSGFAGFGKAACAVGKSIFPSLRTCA